ncbi:MAG: glycosyltransferase [Chitinophagaceae bacterium]|nr:glycosyltransferase [Chitinophagaceae bacterium]
MIKRVLPTVIKLFPLTEKKTLVILTPGFAKDEEDSTCIPMQQSFLRTIKKNYPHLNIIVLAFQYPYHANKYEWHSMTVIPFNGRNKGGLRKFFLFRKIYSVLRSIHRENKIDAILSFWYNECGIAGKRFGDKHRIKHLCWVWGQDARNMNKYPRKLKPSANELVTLSDFLQDEFEKNHSVRPFSVVPPGIDSDLYSSPPAEKDIDIIAAGSLIPLKRYDLFIDLIAEIKKKIPGIKARLIGNGPERQRIERLIHASDLQHNITLSNELSHTELLKQMQRAKVFLHTSSFEGFGIVCIEALQAGAHVISFTKPMKAEIPHWEIAVDINDMVEKVLIILSDPPADHSSITPFTIKASAEKMINLFAL